MFILTPETVLNRSVLHMRQVPKRVLGRVTVIPVRGAGPGLVARMIFEVEMLRYLVSLLPFVIGALVWQQHALAISQAPLVMFMLVYLVETQFLRVPPSDRAGLIEEAEAERGLDLLRVRAVAILTQVAAGRGLMQGYLHLVVEQSDLARIAPLTIVSVQSEDGPSLLALDDREQALIRATLFQPPLDERRLHLINLAQNQPLRDVALDLRGVSAHARLAAMMR